MNFVYPGFLWALLLLGIPIIIHLFNFRRYKTVYFSKVDLLNEAIEHSKSGNTLKHLLILFSRLLAIAALVFAFAQPYISKQEDLNTETISSIYIDNSFSMEAEGQDGNLLNEVKNKAIDLVRSLDENEKINLITSELLSKDQRFYSKSEIIERIKTIDLSPAATQLKNVLNLQADLMAKSENNQNKRLFLFSDFQKSTSSLEDFQQAEIKSYYYLPVAEQKENIYIDSVWFNAPVQSVNLPLKLHFRIKNTSPKPVKNLNLQLKINGSDKNFKTFEIDANSYIEDFLTYSHTTPGIKEGHISIKTNQLFFDDHFYFTYTIQDQVNVLLVSEANNTQSSFENLYGVNDYYNSTSVRIRELKQEDFNHKQLIIFNSVNTLSSGAVTLINEALKSGASIVLIPGKSADLKVWNAFLLNYNLPELLPLKAYNQDLSYFNSNDPLYTGVFDKAPDNYAKSSIFSSYKLKTNQNQNFITLFGQNRRTPFLIYSKTPGNGRIFLQASPLLPDFNNFDKHALFAATFLRIAETSAYQKALYFTINGQGNYAIQQEFNEKHPVHLVNTEYHVDLIPAMVTANNSRQVVFDRLEGVLKQAGFYKLSNNQDFNDQIAFNYSRAESEISSYSADEVKMAFGDIGWNKTELLALNQKGKIEITNIKPKEYWRLFLILALVALGIEMALIRLWKTG